MIRHCSLENTNLRLNLKDFLLCFSLEDKEFAKFGPKVMEILGFLEYQDIFGSNWQKMSDFRKIKVDFFDLSLRRAKSKH